MADKTSGERVAVTCVCIIVQLVYTYLFGILVAVGVVELGERGEGRGGGKREGREGNRGKGTYIYTYKTRPHFMYSKSDSSITQSIDSR